MSGDEPFDLWAVVIALLVLVVVVAWALLTFLH